MVTRVTGVWVRATEYDALAAHVERCQVIADEIRSYVMPHDGRCLVMLLEAVEAKPATSLARLKAEWQAEVLDQLMPAICDVADRAEVRSLRDELRRQAEEPTE